MGETAKKPFNNFNKYPVVFDDCCALSPTTQRVYTRLYSYLWGENTRAWEGSYPKLGQLTYLSTGTAYNAKNQLEKAGLIEVSTLPHTGNTNTLSIKLKNIQRLWALNIRYCALNQQEQDTFCQQCAWKTLDQLEANLSNFEKQKQERLSNSERHLSKNESHQAQSLSKNERELSNSERQDPLSGASKAGSQGPTDSKTDTDLYTDVSKTNEPTSLSPDLLSWFKNIYCKAKFIKVEPKLTESLKGHIATLAGTIQTVEQLNSLYDYTKEQVRKKSDPRVRPGNMVNYLNEWYDLWLTAQEQAQEHYVEDASIEEELPQDWQTAELPSELLEWIERITCEWHDEPNLQANIAILQEIYRQAGMPSGKMQDLLLNGVWKASKMPEQVRMDRLFEYVCSKAEIPMPYTPMQVVESTIMEAVI